MHVAGLGCRSDRAYNVGYLKAYGEHYRLVHMRSVRCAGFESRVAETAKKTRGTAGNDSKMKNSLSRSRAHVWEVAMCNPWEYFVTLTIAAEKHDRYDLHGTYKALSKWLNNYSRKGVKVKYLLIPEPHKDGAWHFHGLLMGLTVEQLCLFSKAEHIPKRIKNMLSEGRKIYNWPDYAKTFGYVTLERIRDKNKCASYITKYITKELENSSIELNHHLYYCSQGLKRAELLYRGQMMREIDAPDFENEYVSMKNFGTPEEAMRYFCDLEVEIYGKNDFDSEGSGGNYAYQPECDVSACSGK